MTIGIDGNEANVENKVGVSTYTYNLLKEFQKKADNNTSFIIYLKFPPLPDMPEENDYFKYKIVYGPIAWSQIFLPFYLTIFREIDVFFSPAHYIPRNCPVPVVVTIHDLAYKYYPGEFLKKDLYKLEKWTEHAIQHASKIIAVSKTTKKDILKYYSIPSEKIEVIYNGFSCKADHSSGTIQIKNKQMIIGNHELEAGKYILYVGTIQPRKNITRLIKAFALVREKFPDYKLVIAGKTGWMFEETIETGKKLGLTENELLFTGYLHDNEIKALYTHALCFVMPSLYEGFGIPLLEAMANKCPVIASYTSSLPEIGGEACIYFDPTNDRDLYEKIIYLQSNKKIRTELIKKGLEQIKQFSWEKSAETTYNVLTTRL